MGILSNQFFQSLLDIINMNSICDNRENYMLENVLSRPPQYREVRVEHKLSVSLVFLKFHL